MDASHEIGADELRGVVDTPPTDGDGAEEGESPACPVGEDLCLERAQRSGALSVEDVCQALRVEEAVEPAAEDVLVTAVHDLFAVRR